MPRKSRAEWEIERFSPPLEPIAIQPPPSLSPAAREAFVTLVSSLPADHFEVSDTSLIARYAVASVLAETAEEALQADPNDSKALRLWEKSTGIMASLALRLRISPQSRRERARAGRQATWSDNFAMTHRDGR
jgi:hypothetical protein